MFVFIKVFMQVHVNSGVMSKRKCTQSHYCAVFTFQLCIFTHVHINNMYIRVNVRYYTRRELYCTLADTRVLRVRARSPTAIQFHFLSIVVDTIIQFLSKLIEHRNQHESVTYYTNSSVSQPKKKKEKKKEASERR